MKTVFWSPQMAQTVAFGSKMVANVPPNYNNYGWPHYRLPPYQFSDKLAHCNVGNNKSVILFVQSAVGSSSYTVNLYAF